MSIARINLDHHFKVVPGSLSENRVQKWILLMILPISFLIGLYGQVDPKPTCWDLSRVDPKLRALRFLVGPVTAKQPSGRWTSAGYGPRAFALSVTLSRAPLRCTSPPWSAQRRMLVVVSYSDVAHPRSACKRGNSLVLSR